MQSRAVASQTAPPPHCYVSVSSDEGAILSTLLYWVVAVWRGGGQGVSVWLAKPGARRSEVIARSSPGEEASGLGASHQPVYRKCRTRVGLWREAGEVETGEDR